jgi:hypothetical protein
MAGDPLSDPREPRLRVQGFRSDDQAVVQLTDRGSQRRIADAGVVDRRAGQPGREEGPVRVA